MAAVLDEVGKSAEKLVDDIANDEIDIEGEDGASEASKKKKRKKKKKKAGKWSEAFLDCNLFTLHFTNNTA